MFPVKETIRKHYIDPLFPNYEPWYSPHEPIVFEAYHEVVINLSHHDRQLRFQKLSLLLTGGGSGPGARSQPSLAIRMEGCYYSMNTRFRR
jgi:hypothetical protein